MSQAPRGFPLPEATFHGEEPPSDRSVRTGRSARQGSDRYRVPENTIQPRYHAGCCAPGAAGEALPRPYKVDSASPKEHPRTTTGAAGGIPVGVRPCLNRRPAQADHPDRRRLPAYHSDHDVPVPDGALPRRWRGGRGSASPLHQVARMFRSGSDAPRSVVPRPSCTGRAVPDPPAHLAGHESAPGHRCDLLYDRAAVYRIRITVPAARSGDARLAPTWRHPACTGGPVCTRSSVTTCIVGTCAA
jgi:hypothetical protein